MAQGQIPSGYRPNSWTAEHRPAVNTLATVTKAAETGRRHIVTAIIGTLVAGASAPTAIQVDLQLKDGATIIWSARMALPATAGESAEPIQLSGLYIRATRGNAVTLDFSAAGGDNTFEGVSLEGHTISTT